jgi:hypothetical protein
MDEGAPHDAGGLVPRRLAALFTSGTLALCHPAVRGMDGERVLLRESFEMSAGALLPDGWSSSHSRFLLWPDFVVASDAREDGHRAALAEHISGDAWLRSPPIASRGCAGIEVRCRMRISRTDDARVLLEVQSEDETACAFAAAFPLKAGCTSEHRIPIDVRGWTGSTIAARWHIQSNPESRPVAVRIGEVLIVGLDDRRWAEREAARADTGFPGPIAINEIMYAPRAGEPEWIELLNVGEGSVSIEGWTVSDASGARSNPLPAVLLSAGSTVVVTRDLSQFTVARGEPPCEAIAPGGMPVLNNGGDAVVVRAPGGKAVDSVLYGSSWGGGTGRSLERRNPRSPPDRENWGESVDSSGATPCAENSIAVLRVDVSVALKESYRFPYGDPALLDAVLRNVGTEPVQDIVVRWFIDQDRDTSADEAEEVVSRSEAGPLLPGDSLVVTAEWTGARPGTHRLIARADIDADERQANNLALAVVAVGHPHEALAINEIMYQPLSGEPEYIELAVVDGVPDVDGWALQLGRRDDGTPEKSIALTGSGGVDEGKGGDGGYGGSGNDMGDRGAVKYVVLASDSSILERFGRLSDSTGGARLQISGSALGLGNGGELIRLVDPSGGTVDSLLYGPDWHDPAFTDVRGRSLEKIHPRLDGAARQSWGTSVAPAGGTPGMQNSIVAPVERHGSALHAAPNPFSPDGDGREDHTVVGYRVDGDAAYTVIRVFDVSGRLIRTLMERERGGYAGETVWDGRDDLSRRVRMGIYILHLEAFDGSGAVVATARMVVAVAGRL